MKKILITMLLLILIAMPCFADADLVNTMFNAVRAVNYGASPTAVLRDSAYDYAQQKINNAQQNVQPQNNYYQPTQYQANTQYQAPQYQTNTQYPTQQVNPYQNVNADTNTQQYSAPAQNPYVENVEKVENVQSQASSSQDSCLGMNNIEATFLLYEGGMPYYADKNYESYDPYYQEHLQAIKSNSGKIKSIMSNSGGDLKTLGLRIKNRSIKYFNYTKTGETTLFYTVTYDNDPNTVLFYDYKKGRLTGFDKYVYGQNKYPVKVFRFDSVIGQIRMAFLITNNGNEFHLFSGIPPKHITALFFTDNVVTGFCSEDDSNSYVCKSGSAEKAKLNNLPNKEFLYNSMFLKEFN